MRLTPLALLMYVALLALAGCSGSRAMVPQGVRVDAAVQGGAGGTDSMRQDAASAASGQPDTHDAGKGATAPPVTGAHDAGKIDGGDAANADAGDAAGSDAGHDAVPESLRQFARDVAAASAAAYNANGPYVCAYAIPAVRVGSPAEAAAGVRAYVAARLGVDESALEVENNPCADGMTAACANIFQNDVAHFGGAAAITTYPLAQMLESRATDVRVDIFSVASLNNATVVISGIEDGWLIAIVTVPNRMDCGE